MPEPSYDLETAAVESTVAPAVPEDKLTDWVNEPTLTALKQNLQDSLPTHNTQTGRIGVWLDNLNITGAAKRPKKAGRSSIVPKLIRKQAEWRYAALSEPFLSTDDIYNTDPVTYEDKKAAIQNGLVLNNQFNTKLSKVSFIDEYVRTAVDEGTVIVRTGWDYEEEVNKVQVPTYKFLPEVDEGAIQEFNALNQAAVQDNSVLQQLDEETLDLYQRSIEAGTVLRRVQEGTHEEDQIKVLKNQPSLNVCSYHNVIIDPTCQGDLKKANFVIYSFETSLSELEKTNKYKNLDKIVASSAPPLSNPDHASTTDETFNFKDKPRTRFVAYEYWGFWDYDNTGVVKPFVATYAGNQLIRMEENPYPDQELPFVSVQYLPVRKSVYGEPDGELLEDNQKVIGAVTRGMIDIMGRSANGQTGIRKDALDVTNRRKFDKGLDYEFNVNVDPRSVMHMHTFPEIPRSAEFLLNQQNAEAESLTAVKSFSGGISGQALGSTATGIRSALDATSKRELGILRRLAEGMITIGRKITSMNGEFLSDTEVVRVTNEEFVEVRRDDLAGNFDLTLTISTPEADNEKAQELSFMLQTMGNSMDPAMSQMLLVDIARLRKMPALAKKLENYVPQPDPIAQEKALLEIELLKAQIQNEQAKGMENAVDVGLKQAKTVTEQAKARNTDSKSDIQDLSFLDQEAGKDIQRDLAKLEHGRNTQLDLKAADALIASDVETE